MTIGGMHHVRDAIRRELRADGCTQRDLAAYVGVSQGHVSRVLGGKRSVHFGMSDFPLIETMAAAVGIGPDDLGRIYAGGTP